MKRTHRDVRLPLQSAVTSQCTAINPSLSRTFDESKYTSTMAGTKKTRLESKVAQVTREEKKNRNLGSESERSRRTVVAVRTKSTARKSSTIVVHACNLSYQSRYCVRDTCSYGATLQGRQESRLRKYCSNNRSAESTASKSTPSQTRNLAQTHCVLAGTVLQTRAELLHDSSLSKGRHCTTTRTARCTCCCYTNTSTNVGFSAAGLARCCKQEQED